MIPGRKKGNTKRLKPKTVSPVEEGRLADANRILSRVGFSSVILDKILYVKGENGKARRATPLEEATLVLKDEYGPDGVSVIVQGIKFVKLADGKVRKASKQ
ncbi:MAG: hypothetical protein V1847_02130 [Candidatus Diapherotrites archaeon]